MMKISAFFTVIVLALVTSSGFAVAQMHGNHHGQSNGSTSSSMMMCDTTMNMSGMSGCCSQMKCCSKCDMMESIGEQGMTGGMNHDMKDSMCGSTGGKKMKMSCKCRKESAAALKDRPELR